MTIRPQAVQSNAERDRKHPESDLARETAASDKEASAFDRAFAAFGVGASVDATSRLLSSPLMRQASNGEVRVLAMRRAQQGVGNHKTQQLVTQLRIPSDSPGQPLDHSTRGFMEARFGTNFSDVRVHTDSRAAQSADALAANAYTTGRDIYFAAGKYAPGSRDGQHLLAHELTHTVQQSQLSLARSSVGDLRLSQPGEPLEREAELIASRIGRDSASVSSAYPIPQGATTMFEFTPVISNSAADGGQVQRYEAYEHAELGDKAALSQKHIIQGIELTSGEIDALGDYYATLNDLQNADKAELAELLRLIRKQKVDPRSVSEADWDRATGGRYTQLNLQNRAHFAPQSAALIAPQPSTKPGMDNRSTWTNYHTQALGEARGAGAEANPSERSKKLAQAKITNAFGEHYLADSFTAGHLFNKDDTVAVVQKGIQGLSSKELDLLLKYAADWIWGIKDLRDLISQYESTAWHHADIDSADRFKKVLEGIHKKRPEAVANAIVKYVHDQLSTWNASGVPGVEVENDYGRWLLSGDKTLRGSTDTQKWAPQRQSSKRESTSKLHRKTRRVNHLQFQFPVTPR
jgi:hypothetical protein